MCASHPQWALGRGLKVLTICIGAKLTPNRVQYKIHMGSPVEHGGPLAYFDSLSPLESLVRSECVGAQHELNTEMTMSSRVYGHILTLSL